VIARVLVAVDSADDLPLVDAACALAQEHRATLEVVGGIARAAPTVSLVACPRALNAELEQYSRSVLCDAVRRVPPDIPVVWRHVRGCARRRILHAADEDEARVVLVGRLPWWARGRLRRRISKLVMCPGAADAAPEPTVALRDGAGTLA
jgi:Universal stress protein family